MVDLDQVGDRGVGRGRFSEAALAVHPVDGSLVTAAGDVGVRGDRVVRRR
jgi:hypothetical protein